MRTWRGFLPRGSLEYGGVFSVFLRLGMSIPFNSRSWQFQLSRRGRPARRIIQITSLGHDLRASDAGGSSFLSEPATLRPHTAARKLDRYGRQQLDDNTRHTAATTVEVPACRRFTLCCKPEQFGWIHVSAKSQNRIAGRQRPIQELDPCMPHRAGVQANDTASDHTRFSARAHETRIAGDAFHQRHPCLEFDSVPSTISRIVEIACCTCSVIPSLPLPNRSNMSASKPCCARSRKNSISRPDEKPDSKARDQKHHNPNQTKQACTYECR